MIRALAEVERNIRNVAEEGSEDKMDEYSRILIEEYCMNHTSAKSRRLWKLVQKSYDLCAEYTDSDGIFIEKVIEQEEDSGLREAFKDLNDFMFGW